MTESLPHRSFLCCYDEPFPDQVHRRLHPPEKDDDISLANFHRVEIIFHTYDDCMTFRCLVFAASK